VPGLDLLSPGIAYPLAVLAFLALGAGGLTLPALLLFLAFLAAFCIAFRFSRPGPAARFPIIWRLGLPLFIIGSLAEFANLLYIGSIPLIIPSMRARLIPSLAYISFLIVPACIILMTDRLLNGRPRDALFWLASGSFLIALLGYRTELFALLLGAFISAYYVKGKSVPRRRAVLLSAIFIMILVSSNLLLFSFRESPLETSMTRFSVTTYVFSSLTEGMGLSLFGISGGLIHSSMLSSITVIPGTKTGPRTFISQLVGVQAGSTTPTILGMPYLDFGLAGVLIGGLALGLLFGAGYKSLRRGDIDILPLHALSLSFLFITIETGIGDAIVLVYLIAYLLMAI